MDDELDDEFDNGFDNGFVTFPGLPIPNPTGVYVRGNDIVQLETKDICCDLSDGLKMVGATGIISDIWMTDFDPKLQYSLNCNGLQLTNSKYNKKLDCQVISFYSLSEANQRFLEIATSEDEPEIPKYRRNRYLNLDRIDSVLIYPSGDAIKKRTLKPIQHLTLVGFFKNDGRWEEGSRSYPIYPYGTYRLNISHPTEFLDVHVRSGQRLQLWLDEFKYKDLSLQDKVGPVRILFDRPDFNWACRGQQDLDLPQSLQTLNCSRLSQLYIVLEHEGTIEERIHVTQYLYRVYHIVDGGKTLKYV